MLKKSNPITSRHTVFTTWILWRHLLHPNAHPLFQRTLKTPVDSLTRPYAAWIVLLVGSLACCGTWTLNAQFRSFIVFILLMAMIVFSSLYTLVWVVGITGTIIREHERGTYDQLCVLPSGALGAHWAMCAASLHRHDALGWIDLLRKLMTGTLLIALLSSLLIVTLRQAVLDATQFFWLVLDMIALVTASYAEHVQSILLGSLTGMLVPVYTRNRADARISAAVLFLALQAATLLATLLIALVFLPTLYSFLSITDWYISPTLVSLLVFFLLREGLIIALWRILVHQLNASPAELSW
jgi:hypothetical protein